MSNEDGKRPGPSNEDTSPTFAAAWTEAVLEQLRTQRLDSVEVTLRTHRGQIIFFSIEQLHAPREAHGSWRGPATILESLEALSEDATP